MTDSEQDPDFLRILHSADKEWPGYELPEKGNDSLPLLISEIYRLIPYIGSEYVHFHPKNMPEVKIDKIDIVGIVTDRTELSKYTSYIVDDSTGAIPVLCMNTMFSDDKSTTSKESDESSEESDESFEESDETSDDGESGEKDNLFEDNNSELSYYQEGDEVVNPEPSDSQEGIEVENPSANQEGQEKVEPQPFDDEEGIEVQNPSDNQEGKEKGKPKPSDYQDCKEKGNSETSDDEEDEEDSSESESELELPFGLSCRAPYSYTRHIRNLWHRARDEEELKDEIELYDYVHVLGICAMGFRSQKHVSDLTDEDMELGRLFFFGIKIRRLSEADHNAMTKSLIHVAKKRYRKSEN